MGHYIAYLHQLLDDISAEDMVKDHLKKWVGHQMELQPVPMPDQDGALLERGDGHLEVLVRGDAEPLGRVQELVLGDEVEGAASLGHQQSAGGGQQLPIVLWVMVVLVMRPSNVSNAV